MAKIVEIRKEEYSGYVYDLNMAKNSNFFADGICIHNCGKKKNFFSVLDNEGVRYKTPKLSITGVEAIKSSTPKIIRQSLRDSLQIILDGGEDAIKEFIEKTKVMFMNSPPEQIAFPRSVSDIEKYLDKKTLYKKGTPINSRAAILFNHYVDAHGLERRYMKIRSGDKMLFAYLRVPNPIRENVIGFIDKLPEEFGLHDYVDYNLQFEKTFLSVLNPIFEKIGWSVGNETDLSDFFC